MVLVDDVDVAELLLISRVSEWYENSLDSDTAEK